MGLSLFDRYKQMQYQTSAPSASDSADLVDVSSTQTITNKVGYLIDKTSATTATGTIAYGTGTLVTGAVVVATGLATVTAFTATISGPSSFATGATEADTVMVSSITTGAVTVKGVFNAFVTGAATISVSGTAKFYWIAIGT